MSQRPDFDLFSLLLLAVPIGLVIWVLFVLWLIFG